MGLFILAGFGFVGWEVYRRATDPTHPKSFARDRQEAPPAPATLATLATPLPLALPAGTRVEALVPAGPRLVLHLRLADGSERLLLVDPARATASPIIEMAPSPAAANQDHSSPTLAAPAPGIP